MGNQIPYDSLLIGRLYLRQIAAILSAEFGAGRRRSWAPKCSIPICFDDCSPTDQIAQSPSSSRRIHSLRKNFLNLPMHTARIPPVDPAPATITAVLVMHAGHICPPGRGPGVLKGWWLWTPRKLLSLVAIGRANQASSPVVSRIHNQYSAPAQPRPYTAAEMSALWDLARQSCNPVIFFTFLLTVYVVIDPPDV